MDVWFTLKSVYDRTTQEQLDVSHLKTEKHVSLYSNTKNPVYRLFYNDKVIKRNNNYMCTYECHNCSRINIVSLNNIIRKLNQGKRNCSTCKEYEQLKRSAQSEFMKVNGVKVRNKEVFKTTDDQKPCLIDKLRQDQEDFDNEDDEYKANYFRKHLTHEEYERVSSKIVSFHHDKFRNIHEFKYFPCVKIGNQTKYNPYLYDPKRDVLEKIIYIHYVCDCCGTTFFNRDLYIQKNKYKLLCNECNFTNNTFKVRTTKNVNGETVRYQSKLEKKFIEFCNSNGLMLKNGPYIPYDFNGIKTYRVDFELPDMKLLLETKDNHIWHQRSIESGRWQAKQQAVCNYAECHGMEFMMVYPKSFIDSTKKILKKANKI